METNHTTLMTSSSLMKRIFITDSSNYALLFIRIIVALVILPHGLQKLTGSFGGYGFEQTMLYFTNTVGLPVVFGLLIITLESFGMLLLAFGFLARPIAALLTIIMMGAASVHISNGFFMNWFGNQTGEGVEFFILTIALALVVLFKGAGAVSIDVELSK